MVQKLSTTVLSNSNDLSTFLPLHYQKSTDFLEQMDASIKNWDDAWEEMIYCVLAGTQVSTNIVKKSYLNLIDSIPEVTDYNYIATNPEKYADEISSVLHKNGYRFYSTKSMTIINAAKFFHNFVEKYQDIKQFNPHEARKILIQNINGIGNKIASHWIRNIGHQMPIIDVHVRRVLCCAGFIDKKYLKNQISDSEYQYIENVVVDLAKRINIDVGRLDYILWIHGREYCIRRNCSSCPIGENNV
jgi:thermostable 8-oxoguanine DNA glycosylase